MTITGSHTGSYHIYRKFSATPIFYRLRYLEAAKIWIKLGNQVFACKCAEAAYKLGSRKGHEIFIALSRINTLEFDKASKKVIW